MSFTYAHYAAPSSLPSDYAILSRYAAANSGVDEEDTTENMSVDEDTQSGAGEVAPAIFSQNLLHPNWTKAPRRRSSFPTVYIRPLNPNTTPIIAQPGSSVERNGSKVSLPSETSPLLGPLVPRIEEDVCREEREGSERIGRAQLFVEKYWEEFKILLKYTLPVFGYVRTIRNFIDADLAVACIYAYFHLVSLS